MQLETLSKFSRPKIDPSGDRKRENARLFQERLRLAGDINANPLAPGR